MRKREIEINPKIERGIETKWDWDENECNEMKLKEKERLHLRRRWENSGR